MNMTAIEFLQKVIKDDELFVGLIAHEENRQVERGLVPDEFVTGILIGWKLRSIYEKETSYDRTNSVPDDGSNGANV